MTEDNGTKRAEAWNKLGKSFDLVQDFIETMQSIDSGSTNKALYEYNLFSKNDTQRTHARIKDKHLALVDKNYKDWGFRSREICVGAAIAFALKEQEAFLRYTEETRICTSDKLDADEDKSSNSSVEKKSTDNRDGQEDKSTNGDVREDGIDNISMEEIEKELESK